MSYHLLATLSPPDWLCINVGSCVRHFNVSLSVWAKSQDGVHKPPFLKREESWSRSNQGTSAYRPSTLLPGHTCSLVTFWYWEIYTSRKKNQMFYWSFCCVQDEDLTPQDPTVFPLRRMSYDCSWWMPLIWPRWMPLIWPPSKSPRTASSSFFVSAGWRHAMQDWLTVEDQIYRNVPHLVTHVFM